MGKKRRSYPKSVNLRIDFKPNTIIYEQKVQTQNTTNTMEVDVKPHNPNEATIESNLKTDKE